MRILHFSDVHLDVRNTDVVRQTMDRMISCVKKYYGELVSFDLIVFSGDMIDRGGLDESQNVIVAVQDGLNVFRDMVIQPICKAFHLEPDHFIVTMGNHDADWKLVGDDIKNKIRDLRKNDGAIYDFYRNNIVNDHASWIQAFNQFRDSLYSTVDYNSNPAFANVIYTIGGKKVGVSILNSAWGSLPGEDVVYLERAQIADSRDYLQKRGCDYRICVMHNPYHSLCEQELVAVRKMIMKNYDACFTGHTHQPDGLGLANENHICYLSTAYKISSADRDVKEHDRRYANGFVVFEDDGEKYRVARYVYNESYEFELQGDIEETRKSPQRYVNNISALFELSDELRTADFRFLRSERLNEIIEDLRGDKYQFIRLSALSGFGKTRLIYETFLEQQADLIKPEAYAYYCESYPDNKLVFNEIKAIVKCNASKQGLIILDNCKRSLMSDVVEFMRGEDTGMRLIAIDNNPYDSADMSPYFYPIIVEPDVIRDSVNTYIDEQLSLPDYFERKEDVKTLADGSPYMAYRLIEKLRESGSVGIGSIRDLIMDMLDVEDKEEADEYQRALQAMALFQPMPTEEGNKEAYDFIVGNTLITHLKGTDMKYRQDVFQRVLRRYEKTLIDKEKDWLVVRPYPLAIWLIQEWFEIVHSEKEFVELIESIEQQPDSVKRTLPNNLFRRINSMQESIPAKQLADKLFDKYGPFCSEKVVCSDMGSRLFLAMATVNPEKVAACMRYLFRNKDAEWIRTNVSDEVHQTLMRTLKKLCFAKESYDDAVQVMAQFVESGHDYWSNNSRNDMMQLFPIVLADTEVELSKRVDTLAMLWAKGYKNLALSCLNVAFKNGSFMRMGGAETFGWRHRDSFAPTNRQVYEYWDVCLQLLWKWYEDDASILPEIKDLAETRVPDWRSFFLTKRYLFPIIDVVAPQLGWQWNTMYELLLQSLRFNAEEYSEEEKAVINAYIEKLSPTIFADQLLYAGRKVFDYEGMDKDMYVRAHEVLMPMAERFVNEKIYANISEVKALIDMQSGDSLFVNELKELLSDEALNTLMDIVWTIVEERKDDFVSPFFNGVLVTYKQSEPVRQFIARLFECGYKRAYVRAMAAVEDEGMSSYQELLDQYKASTLSFAHIKEYLQSLWGLNQEQMYIILPSLMETFEDEYASILAFAMKHRYWTNMISGELSNYLRELLLKTPWVDEQYRCNYDVIMLVKDYLKQNKESDIEFGAEVNRKLIQILSGRYVHNSNIGELYAELLQEPYQDVMWDDFTEALTNNIGFFMEVQFAIGSGFSYGKGPLFQYVPEDKLKAWCAKDNKAIHYLACMAPVFQYEDGKMVDLSEFLRWMIETYGDKEEVVSGISSNMNTLSWTGSTIPLHEDIIKVLEPYQGHRFKPVRDWAEREINYLRNDIDREKSQEDYMRMHYN